MLDELNLAPSDVLESLNRLLDSNRELYVPHLGVIRPHPHFMLFATQNPSTYSGRKILSRAFRGRFNEIQVTNVPTTELAHIISMKCGAAPSFCAKIVECYTALRNTRSGADVFSKSFVTLRDLFRWAGRPHVTILDLARIGYMLLAERRRSLAESISIGVTIEKIMKVKLDMLEFYQTEFTNILPSPPSSVIWTIAMKRLYVLLNAAIDQSEPVLLIGETGCGKTTICQIAAAQANKSLHIVNAHQNSDTADFLGSLRPNRAREQALSDFDAETTRCCVLRGIPVDSKSLDALRIIGHDMTLLDSLLRDTLEMFKWHDGPLVQAMQSGDFFLLDEISLAEDSVLERLNSVLEPQRILVLVEKGVGALELTADSNFRFVSTMNPGGDYGKKELSPALRNRMTEIWVPSITSRDDLMLIISSKLTIIQPDIWAAKILDFLEWFATKLRKPLDTIVSLRDILAWVRFIGDFTSKNPLCSIATSFMQGGCMVLLDGIGVNPLFGTVGSVSSLIKASREMMASIADLPSSIEFNLNVDFTLIEKFGIVPFYIDIGDAPSKPLNFALNATTTKLNAMRVLRAMQLVKPVLLEGSPGVGKTSLISSIAAVSNHYLVRINLSEQTDLMDLFGSDLPVEGVAGRFEWRDGPFLQAMKRGHWVLLDELNLASQQVLEGLNACLDHRASIYIPELDSTFQCHPDFRVFACQNPQSQGGGRKGLPKSFVNRFTQVFVSPLEFEDLMFICTSLYPDLETDVSKLIRFNEMVKEEIMDKKTFGWAGSPWEFNLRDVLRWIDLINHGKKDPSEYLHVLYASRMRTSNDRLQIRSLYEKVFDPLPLHLKNPPCFRLTESSLTIGSSVYHRKHFYESEMFHDFNLQILPTTQSVLESMIKCIQIKVMPLLVGPTCSGKTSLVRLLASVVGEKLVEFPLNPEIDALELLGGYEQVDLVRRQQIIIETLAIMVYHQLRFLNSAGLNNESDDLAKIWQLFKIQPQIVKCEDTLANLLSILTKNSSLSEIQSVKLKYAELQRITISGVQGQFEWIDSVLIEALEKGYWILLDNVNLCSSSVLDRLNSLLEVNGVLTLNERGLVNGEIKIITPHSNFRIFMAMDPKYGEISRAMRNRSIEIFITDYDLKSEAVLLSNVRVLSNMGLPGLNFARSLGSEQIFDFSTSRLVAGRIKNGICWKEALLQSGIESVETSDQENMNLVTSFPDFVSSIDSRKDSTRANVKFDGSLLLHLVTDDLPYHFTASHRPTRNALIDEALINFFLLSSPKDFSLRIEFVEGLITQNASSKFSIDLENFVESIKSISSSVRRTFEIRNVSLAQICNEILSDVSDIVTYILTKPLNLNQTRHSEYGKLLRIIMGCLMAERKRKQLEFAQIKSYQFSESTKVTDLNLAQVSYAYRTQRLKDFGLYHPVVPTLHPLFELYHVALLEMISMTYVTSDLNSLTWIEDCIINMKNLWSAMEHSKLYLIVITLSKLYKTFPSDSELPGMFRLKEALELSAFHMALDKIRSSSLLWKSGGVITLRRKELWDVGQKLWQANAKCNIWSGKIIDWFSSSRFTNNLGTKRAILESMSTLYYLNDQKEIDLNLFAAIANIPDALGLQVSAIPREDTKSLAYVQESQEICSSIIMWPINDANILYREMEILAKLHEILSLSEEVAVLNIQLQLKGLIDFGLENSSFPPLHFEPLQRLLWYIEGHNDLILSEQSSFDFLKTILSRAMLEWNQAFWKNGSTFFAHALHNPELLGIFSCQIMPLLFQEVEHKVPRY